MRIDELMPEQIILSEMGKRLASIRKQRRKSQTVLAEEAGIGVATLRRIELGQSGQMETWLKIMKALHMTPAIEAFLPEKFDSPRDQVLSGQSRRSKKSAKSKISESDVVDGTIPWGDQISDNKTS